MDQTIVILYKTNACLENGEFEKELNEEEYNVSAYLYIYFPCISSNISIII